MSQRFRCDFCDRVFLSPAGRTNHITRKHAKADGGIRQHIQVAALNGTRAVAVRAFKLHVSLRLPYEGDGFGQQAQLELPLAIPMLVECTAIGNSNGSHNGLESGDGYESHWHCALPVVPGVSASGTASDLQHGMEPVKPREDFQELLQVHHHDVEMPAVRVLNEDAPFCDDWMVEPLAESSLDPDIDHDGTGCPSLDSDSELAGVEHRPQLKGPYFHASQQMDEFRLSASSAGGNDPSRPKRR